MEKEFLDIVSDLLNQKKDTRSLCLSGNSAFSIIEDSNEITAPYIESVKKILTELKIIKNKKLAAWYFNLFLEEKNEVMKTYDNGIRCLGNLRRQSTVREIRSQALKSLIYFLPEQARLLNGKPTLLTTVLRNVVLIKGPINDLLEPLRKFVVYEDVRVSLWKALEILVQDSTLQLGESEVSNILSIIALQDKPNLVPKMENDEKKYLCGKEGAVLSKKRLCSIIQNLWTRLMIVELKPATKQSLLVNLIEQLMPRMDKPIFLTDYFMACLDEGGAVSLLGLQGIFNLIQKHNINYPNIYNKLYSLLTADIFSTKYKARFFYLSDVFLTSSHLPETIVAGFIKRLARLSLVAPPADIIIIMAFITNLVIRHPGLKKMLHHSHGQEVKTDPYLFEEPDPSKSCAINSSVWEIQLLQHHVLPSVASSAMFISKPLPSVEIDLGDLLEVDTTMIFNKEFKKKMKETPVAFERPTSLLLPRGESGFVLWDLND